ncbi:MAG TPA: N,N-dimethylformamidase beta subunit family domain-containing protein [Acidimicrobiales bacterium]|nr:N,N-dimethylformamidase beta subunit family domain-containing protein [Acidimicrobiales bacterium]
MQGPSLTRVLCVIVVVVVIAVGAVALLVPSSERAAGTDAVGPPLPGSAGTRVRAGGDPAAWLIDENQKPGTFDWQVKGPINKGNIEGFAEATSVNKGESVRLFISTDSPGYHIEAYRMGYYGGKQGRLVWRSGNLVGSRQAPPVVDFSTRMAEAKWRPSLTLNVDATWPPGNYLIKLVADNGFQQFIPLAVRDDSSHAPLLVMNAVTTWQAYNKWGGHSLYEGQSSPDASFTPQQRSQVVSFDRPYVNDSGSGDFLGNELPLVTLVESLGLDVTYWTNIDLQQRPQLLANHKAILTLGHDEYWSLEMRQALERARDGGMNVAFFGANAIYRAIRLGPSDLGANRREFNYRVARDDPMTGVDSSRVTVSWREAPLNRPESALVGTYYECNPVKADLVVADPSAWVFAGTGLAAGDKLKNVVGPEFDRYEKSAPQPPGPVQVLSHSPVRCHGKASFSDMTYYSTPSGAGVFATGTNWWISRLGPACAPNDCVDESVVRITQNVLKVFAVGPAGQAHPSTSNVSRLNSSSTSSTATMPSDEDDQQFIPTSTTRRTTTALPTTTTLPLSVPPAPGR